MINARTNNKRQMGKCLFTQLHELKRGILSYNAKNMFYNTA